MNVFGVKVESLDIKVKWFNFMNKTNDVNIFDI